MSVQSETQTGTVTDPYPGHIVPRILRLRADYDIYRSESGQLPSSDSRQPGSDTASQLTSNQNSDDQIDPSVLPHPRVSGIIRPSWWPINHRRIPDYAPINYELDFMERPAGSNPVISFLLTMTFTGCSLLSTYAWTWRNTVGTLNSKLFQYEVGGEF